MRGSEGQGERSSKAGDEFRRKGLVGRKESWGRTLHRCLLILCVRGLGELGMAMVT